MKLNTHQEANEINKMFKEIFREEIKNVTNANESALIRIDDFVLEYLVDYWYTCRQSEIFLNNDGLEIDEFLNVEEYKF